MSILIKYRYLCEMNGSNGDLGLVGGGGGGEGACVVTISTSVVIQFCLTGLWE